MTQIVTVRNSKRRGTALISAFIMMSLVSVAAVTYVGSASQRYREAKRQTLEIQTTHLCEAGVQAVLRSMWRPFKINQTFDVMDGLCVGATSDNPMGSLSGTVPHVGAFAAGVISYYSPNNDPYSRIVTVRAVGWMDSNGNGVIDPGEPTQTVDVSASFQLSRSQVFDYAYFVNNYGWMDGFQPSWLVVNGDMRANGNFAFTNGYPTVNGSVFACSNDKLVPPAIGLINDAPVKWDNSTYGAAANGNPRMRQAYNAATHGAYGSGSYENWKDFLFDTNGHIDNNGLAGAALGDSTGLKSWAKTSSGMTPIESMLDPTPTSEVIMPDLSNLAFYQNLSNNYVDTKQFFGDGTPNPNFNQGAFVQTWNPAANGGTGAYQTITTNGQVLGSAAMIGTPQHPILVHGPVTFSQDAVIEGNVSGQGTLYTGRNAHVIGSILYTNPPDFRGVDQTSIDNANEKKDMLALAARGSVILGDPSGFTNAYPLRYMTPPFTHARYDDNGNLIPAFDAKQVDGTGFKRYQSVMGDAYLHSIAQPVNQIDAILYTNFVGGGNIGTGGRGVHFNGSIISKDEAMVVWSLPMDMNYDHRIRERTATNTPLIDLQLPRSPVMLRSTWKDRGFVFDFNTGA